MLVQGQLVGASKPFESKKNPGNWYMNVHLLMKSDKPSEGFTAHTALLDPDDFIGGASSKFPRDCKIGIQLMGSGGFRIVSVQCGDA